jgi:hypothetical protein
MLLKKLQGKSVISLTEYETKKKRHCRSYGFSYTDGAFRLLAVDDLLSQPVPELLLFEWNQLVQSPTRPLNDPELGLQMKSLRYSAISHVWEQSDEVLRTIYG